MGGERVDCHTGGKDKLLTVMRSVTLCARYVIQCACVASGSSVCLGVCDVYFTMAHIIMICVCVSCVPLHVLWCCDVVCSHRLLDVLCFRFVWRLCVLCLFWWWHVCFNICSSCWE